MRAGGIKRRLTGSHLGSLHDSVFVRGQSGQARINLLGSRFFGVPNWDSKRWDLGKMMNSVGWIQGV